METEAEFLFGDKGSSAVIFRQNTAGQFEVVERLLAGHSGTWLATSLGLGFGRRIRELPLGV